MNVLVKVLKDIRTNSTLFLFLRRKGKYTSEFIKVLVYYSFQKYTIYIKK